MMILMLYFHFHSLSRYGWRAWESKEKNKWLKISDDCKTQAQRDKDIARKECEMREDIQKRLERELPALHDSSGDSDEEIKCDNCEVVFQDVNDVRNHFKQDHPGAEVKFKRGKGYNHKAKDEKR